MSRYRPDGNSDWPLVAMTGVTPRAKVNGVGALRAIPAATVVQLILSDLVWPRLEERYAGMDEPGTGVDRPVVRRAPRRLLNLGAVGLGEPGGGAGMIGVLAPRFRREPASPREVCGARHRRQDVAALPARSPC
jgi:hypothetical protein